MTTRELFNAYVRGHRIALLGGKESQDLLMLPVLLGCYRDIYHKHIKGTEKTSTQRRISATIHKTLRDLIGREYWGMTADEIDAFCDYMDNMTDELNWHILGIQRAVYNCYDGWDEEKKEVISWSIAAHSIAYTTSVIRKKMFPPVSNRLAEVDRQRLMKKFEQLDTLVTEYGQIYDNRPDAVFSPTALEGIENASNAFVDRLLELIERDIDKKI